MDIKGSLKDLLLQLAEKLVKDYLLPELKKKVQDSESKIDDAIYAAVEPALLELAEKIHEPEKAE